MCDDDDNAIREHVSPKPSTDEHALFGDRKNHTQTVHDRWLFITSYYDDGEKQFKLTLCAVVTLHYIFFLFLVRTERDFIVLTDDDDDETNRDSFSRSAREEKMLARA